MLGTCIISSDFNILQSNGRYAGRYVGIALIISCICCPIILKLLRIVANEMSSNNNEQLKRIIYKSIIPALYYTNFQPYSNNYRPYIIKPLNEYPFSN